MTCRETVGDWGGSLSQMLYFSMKRRCRRLPTDTTVKSEVERGDSASVSLTMRARQHAWVGGDAERARQYATWIGEAKKKGEDSYTNRAARAMVLSRLQKSRHAARNGSGHLFSSPCRRNPLLVRSAESHSLSSYALNS
jgi:hypothetical protein